jgi:IS1 family transposase
MPPSSVTRAEAIDALHYAYKAVRRLLQHRLGSRTRKKLEKLRDLLADVLIRHQNNSGD